MPFPYPVGSFSTTPSTDTGGVRAFALGGVVHSDLFAAVKQAITALATGAAGAARSAPTHIGFGLRSALALPGAPAGAVQAEVKLRADAFRIALSSGAAQLARPAHSLTVLATLRRVNGWLAGAPNSYAGEGAPPVDVRVRWAELGATIVPGGSSITVTPLVRLNAGETKSGDGRIVQMTQDVDTLIQACVFGKRPSDYVFTRTGNKLILDFRGAWETLTATAGRTGLLFHDLRRSAGSQHGTPRDSGSCCHANQRA